MLRTIKLGSCVSVQGFFLGMLPNGMMQVRVGDRVFQGTPISKAA
ncbi:hypothetical protein [Roseovarius sp. EL26]|nr:hypothetical protein [Roseovarius sp. EL26]